MLRISNDNEKQTDFVEATLPKELFELDEELKGIDRLLEDRDLLEPFLSAPQKDGGRPTLALESYLRMMYLKNRYGLGYETLVREVSDSIKWRTFCKFKLSDPLPDPTTLLRTTRRYGEGTLKELYRRLLGRAREQKVLRKAGPRRRTAGPEAERPEDGSRLWSRISTLFKRS
jgi:transposase, IS5 family